MQKRDYWLLFFVGLIVTLVLAALQPVPGYMDADYYFAGGRQLAGGHGFSDPFLWNYLDHPQGLPHPSNSYWNPLASMIAAGGMALTGKLDFLSARIGFILMATLAPLLIAALAYRISGRRSIALAAGFLAVFSGYYLPFIVTTDNYGLYMLLGALYFLTLDRLTVPKIVFLGLMAGLINLARGDGLLWLPFTLLAVIVLSYRQDLSVSSKKRILKSSARALLAFLGYLLVMGAWFVRNWIVFGVILAPGSGSVLWMTSYNQFFSFTPGQYTFHSWLASGLGEAVKVRASALWQNLGTAFFAQGMILLSPLIVLGIWKKRRLFQVQFGLFGWICMLLAESLLFPFASVSGGFFHAGTAFQPLWFALAPAGLEVLSLRISRNKVGIARLVRLFPSILIVIAILFSVMLVKLRVLDSGWNEGEYFYLKAEKLLEEKAVPPHAVVMVRNPPAYFIMTGRKAIVVPFGDVQTLLAASQKYSASYIMLEEISKNNPLYDLYAHPDHYPQFTNLGVLGDNHILRVAPAQ
jgi:hypothetical protein